MRVAGRRLFRALVASLMLILASSANAEPITFDFTARVTSITTSGNIATLADIAAGVVVGVTEVTGSFTYELLQSSVFGEYSVAGGLQADYELQSYSLTLPTLTFNESIFDNPAAVTIRDNVNFGAGTNDQFLLSGVGVITPNFQRPVLAIILCCNSSNLSALTSTDLPEDLPLSSFTTETLTFNLEQVGPGFSNYGVRQINGNITSLSVAKATSVPEPASFSLLLMGFGVVAAARSRKRA